MITRDHPKIEMANADGTDRQVSIKIIRQKLNKKQQHNNTQVEEMNNNTKNTQL